MKKLFKNKLFLTVFGIVVIGGGYLLIKGSGSGALNPQYVTAKAEKGTLVVSVTGSGQISVSNQTNIQAQGSGLVKQIAVVNNQKVRAGDLLVRLDTTNDDRAVRNAKANLDNANLQLETLLASASTSSLLQAEQSALQAKQNLQTDQNNLVNDYNSTYTAISNAFINIPGVMTGLNNVLYSMSINKVQNNVDAYVNAVSSVAPQAVQYGQSAITAYQTAFSTYNQNFADFKNTDVYSGTSTIEALLTETYSTLETISVANTNLKNLLDFVGNTLQQYNQKPPSQLAIDETSLQSYISTTNNQLSAVSQIKNSLVNDKQAINTAVISVAQTAAAFDQLKNGPTTLQIQSQQLSVKQSENSLSDAKENLNNDYVRAPFDGIVTNITAKIGQPASGALAVILSNQQIAQATLNEVDIVNVKVGQPATITFDALPNLTLTGKVSQVDTLGTVAQGVVSYNVQVALDAPNADIKPDMSDTASIVTKVKTDTLIVPNTAVSTKQNVSTVQVMGSDGVPVPTVVTLGLVNDQQTEILSGINEGDTIVTQTITKTTTSATTPSTGLGGIRLPGFGGNARPGG